MSDFITLNCPSCGGKLSFSRTQATLVCEHCNTEHLVRNEGGTVFLESYARCPRCGRNDRVEKVSSIIRSQTRQSTAFTRVTENYTDHNGVNRTRTRMEPTTSTETSLLSQRLAPPPRPPVTAGGITCAPILAYFIGVVFLFTGFCCATPSYIEISNEGVFNEKILSILMFLFISGVGIAICVGMVFLGSKLNKKSQEDKKRRREADAQNLAKWERALRKWNRMYYCFRDDVVFILGKQQSTDPDRMQQLLYTD